MPGGLTPAGPFVGDMDMRTLCFSIAIPDSREGYTVGQRLVVSGEGVNARAGIVEISTSGVIARVAFNVEFTSARYFALIDRFGDGRLETVSMKRTGSIDINLGEGRNMPQEIFGFLIGF